jgi:hypothetical protein
VLPQHRQEQRPGAEGVPQHQAVVPQDGVQLPALLGAPPLGPEPQQNLDIALRGIAIGMGDPECRRAFDLAQQPADLLPAVRARPAVEIVVPVGGQRQERAQAVVDAVLLDAADLGDVELGRGKRLHEERGAALRGAQELQAELRPVQLLGAGRQRTGACSSYSGRQTNPV